MEQILKLDLKNKTREDGFINALIFEKLSD